MRTIVALATGEARAAIAIFRLSGQGSFGVIGTLLGSTTSKMAFQPRRATLRPLYDGEDILDEALITYFPGPRSYTGEDMVEISCHASPYVMQRLLALLVDGGAVLAKPGEFTQRAFLNGKLDLCQAEGVGDLIESTTEAQHRAALRQMRGSVSAAVVALREQLLHLAAMVELEIDFGEEDVEFASRLELRRLAQVALREVEELAATFRKGNALRKGLPVAIIGAPNSGKSSLLNHFLGEQRAIVTDIPGTTRDCVSGEIELGGLRVLFSDTAGLRETGDVVERIGIERAIACVQQAEVALLMVDSAQTLSTILEGVAFLLSKLPAHVTPCVVLSRADLSTKESIDVAIRSIRQEFAHAHVVSLSLQLEGGDGALRQWITGFSQELLPSTEGTIITSVRHYQSLSLAAGELERLLEVLDQGFSQDILAFHIRAVSQELGVITGEIGVEDILDNIFSNFCIGK